MQRLVRGDVLRTSAEVDVFYLQFDPVTANCRLTYWHVFMTDKSCQLFGVDCTCVCVYCVRWLGPSTLCTLDESAVGLYMHLVVSAKYVLYARWSVLVRVRMLYCVLVVRQRNSQNSRVWRYEDTVRRPFPEVFITARCISWIYVEPMSAQ